MSRVDAAAPDRLPWLPDEPKSKPANRRGGALVGWASAAAVIAVAGASFWIGIRNVENPPVLPAKPSAPTATVRLPEAREAQPEVRMPTPREVSVAPAPQVRQAPAREVRIAAPPPAAKESKAAETKAATVAEAQPKAEAAPTVVQSTAYVPPKPWNPRIFAGAAGRVVQVGAFGSIHQSKRGWWYMVRAYPAMRRLPAVVRPSKNSKGRVFYRFQIGTTSQAHSEILCQRMQKIGLSCAVVGLPWKAKVER